MNCFPDQNTTVTPGRDEVANPGSISHQSPSRAAFLLEMDAGFRADARPRGDGRFWMSG